MLLPALAQLLPAGEAGWLTVPDGESGAIVVRDNVGERYAKLVTAENVADLAAERDRIGWLQQYGIQVASVLDWRVNDRGACLVTRAVPGVPAHRLDPEALWQVWPAITDLVRSLHDIDVVGCPFDRSLATMMPLARSTVAENRVHVGFLPEEWKGTPPASILELLERELQERCLQERSEQVVCHGDLCLPNILIDPGNHHVTGLVDVGRLGRADPYADVALLLTNARESWPDEFAARRADDVFTTQYGIELDAGRLRFYLLLDPLTWPSSASTLRPQPPSAMSGRPPSVPGARPKTVTRADRDRRPSRAGVTVGDHYA